MKLSEKKETIDSFILNASAYDGFILAGGVIALVLGVLVDVFVVRLLCLFVVLASAVLTFMFLKSKYHIGTQDKGSESSLFRTQPENAVMKKMNFDDIHVNEPAQFFNESVDSRFDQVKPVSVVRQPALADVPAMSSHSFKPTSRQDAHNAVREFNISDFFDADSEIYKGESEPRAEFDFLLLKVLGVIKEVLFANSVAFFWANREKQQMVLEARITDSQHFMTSRRFVIGHDLVSKVAITGKPELVTEINPNSVRELFPYYDVPAAVHSFVGVPVYFSKPSDEGRPDHPVAVVVVDGVAEDEFGQETLVLLGQFTKLISALIKSYTDKYDLLLDSELLRSIRRLQERVRNNFSLNSIVQSLAEETSKLINWDYLSVVLYDETRHAWVAKKVTNRSNHAYIIPEQTIDFPGSIVGQTIKNNIHTTVDALESIDTPRYFAGEKLEKKGSLVSVPISSLNKCYGAVNIESREKYNFSRQDTEMLYRLAENVAAALEILYLQEVINEYVIIDDTTGMYSRKFFLQKMEEELQRADDTGSELSMMFVTIDKAQELEHRYGKPGFERVIATLAKAIRASVRSYDVVGRHEYNQFGIILANTASNEAYIWAEKIRKNVAGHVISLDGKSFSVTISIGVCGVLDGMRKEELLGNTLAVIHRASEAGGNTVRVF